MAGVGFYAVPDSRWRWDLTQIVGLRLTLGNLDPPLRTADAYARVEPPVGLRR